MKTLKSIAGIKRSGKRQWLYTRALEKPCSTCGAGAGAKCIAVTRPEPRFAYAKKPHGARLRAAGILLLGALALAGCVDQGEQPPSLVELCGERPLTPARSTAFITINDLPYVQMRREAYLELEAWISANSAYVTCVEAAATLER